VVLQRNAAGGRKDAGVTDQRFAPSKYLSYQRLIRQIREVVRAALPPGATVIVVSRGDEALLELGDGRRGWHFPQDEDGVYAGHYPAGSAEAIAQLEEIRARGADFLLFPATAFWWLEHYGEFRQHLEDRYQLFVRQEETCLIYALRESDVEWYDALVQGSRARTATPQDGRA
jgi:hypothetical protein